MNPQAVLADSLPRPVPSQGYVAHRHELQPDLIVVWATCGCYWVGRDKTEHFVTICMLPTCSFDWNEVLRALDVLKIAEEQDAKDGLHAVRSPSDAVGLDTKPVEPVDSQVSDAVQASDMISEGGPVDLYDEIGGES